MRNRQAVDHKMLEMLALMGRTKYKMMPAERGTVMQQGTLKSPGLIEIKRNQKNAKQMQNSHTTF